MKTNLFIKINFIILLNLIVFSQVFSQGTWKIVGKAGFSPDARMTAICLNSKGIPYVVFQENFPSFNEITVMSYNGIKWEIVGKPKFSPGFTGFPGIAMGKNDTPYVVFRDVANNGQANVMKFNGLDWVTVGDLSSTSGGVQFTSIVIDKNGMPYIGFSDLSDSSKATVMKYDGNSWIAIGKKGFSKGSAGEPKLVLGLNDTPYMVYSDGDNGNRITVMKYDGLNWNSVGISGFSVGSVSSPSIAINSKGYPFVAFIDGSNGNKATVMEFKGGIWSIKGSALVESFEVSLALGNNDTPYLAFNTGGSRMANMMKFNGNTWIKVGDDDFSPGKTSYISMVLDINDKPYVVFLDATFTTSIGRITVMSYENQTSINTLSTRNILFLYPNPASDFVQVSFDSKENLSTGVITIVNNIGKIVKIQTIQTNTDISNYIVELDNIETGIYLIKVQYGAQIGIAKLVVE